MYEPAEDSELILRHIHTFIQKRKVKTVLDMGCGSGILSEEASKYTETVVGVDKDPLAISYCKDRYKHIANLHFIRSDLFSKIPRKKYDLLLFNPPYLPNEKKFHDPALHGGKKGYETTLRFLHDAPKYLSPTGAILLVASSLTPREVVEKYLHDNNYSYLALETVGLFFEQLTLYQITLRKN
jgi:release factor glutamine methyltransferase